tara:strand:- start:72 stop:662 length:591 start_codon:yes stop_codon:yes gene_type:complete
MALKNDPQLAQEVQNSPAGGAVSGALDAHIREHLAFVFRRQIEEELGITLPPQEEQLPPDLEKRLSTLIADAADQMMGKKQQQAQAEKFAQQQEDPIVQMRQRELAIQEMDAQRRQQADTAKQQVEQQKLSATAQERMTKLDLDMQKLELERQKLLSKERMDEAELALEAEKFDVELEIDGYKYATEQNKGEQQGE